jgi:hypothetical protein
MLLVCACASQNQSNVAQAVSPDYEANAPRVIAVLPFDNMSTDLDATPLVRPIVAGRLASKGYDVPDLKWTDQALQEAGVLVSHDVYGFKPQELGDILQADAVMFGTITDFTTKYAAVYASVAVQLRLELVDCKSGEILWQDERRASRNTAIESVLTLLSYHDDLEKGVAVVAAQNALWAALESYLPYGQEAAALTLSSLPPGYRGQSAYLYDQDPDAFTKDAARVILYQSIILTAPP